MLSAGGSQIIGCPFRLLTDVISWAGASHVVTMLSDADDVPPLANIDPQRHLRLNFSDVVETRLKWVAPSRDDIERLISFVRAWDRRAPMVVHCYAGVSRSAAAALIALVALNPGVNEPAAVGALVAASPVAAPNRLMIALADDILGRGGLLVAAVGDRSMPVAAGHRGAFSLNSAL